MQNPPGLDVTQARRLLDLARQSLDEAVSVLPGVGGDDMMATPALLSLLLNAVKAKRDLDGLLLLVTEAKIVLRPV